MSIVSRRADLRDNELVRIWRLRQRWDRTKAGRYLGVSRYRVGELERGEVALGDLHIPWTGSSALEDHERCLVYRMRSGGVTQGTIAAALGRSRLWVNKMEQGQVRCDDLLYYWEQQV